MLTMYCNLQTDNFTRHFDVKSTPQGGANEQHWSAETDFTFYKADERTGDLKYKYGKILFLNHHIYCI